MKKVSFLSLLLLLLSSCQVDELLAPEKESTAEKDGKMATYYVGIDNGADTRTSLGKDNAILWSEGDKMNIFFGVNNDNKDKLTLMEGAGTKNGSFQGPYIATSDLSQLHQTVIVYPFDENNTCVANEDKTEYTVGLTIPTVQEYTEGTFAVGSNLMIGVTEGVKEVVIETKNVISSLRFSLLGTSTIAKIVLYSDELALAGPANVVASYGNVPVATVLEATASNTVELECGEGVQLNETTPTDFYVTFAPCTGILKAKIYDTDGGYMDISLTEDVKEFERNMIYRKSLTYAADHSIEDDLLNAFKNGGEYTLPIDVTVSKALAITGGKTLNLDLNGNTLTTTAKLNGTSGCIQATGAELNISNGKIVSTEGYLFVTNSYNEKLHLELTDVDIEKTGGTAAFYFADGTDIVLNNVNIDTKGRGFYSFNSAPEGSIVISGGKHKSTGKMFDFKPTMTVSFLGESMFSDNSYTGVQWEETGDEVYPWKPVGHKVFVGLQGFYSLAEAVASVEESATVTLAADLELTETVTIPAGKSIVLDLAGNTISQSKECTGSYEMIKNNGTLTITGEGTLRFEDLSNGGESSWGSYIINNTGTLVVENGTLEHLGTAGDNFSTCIPIHNYAGKVTVIDGVISSPEFRSLRDFTAGGEIEIKGGVFKGQVWMQGLGTGSSTLVVKGGEFGPTGKDGSSIFITNETNDVKVSIEGGKFNTKIGCTDATKAGVAGCIAGGLFTESAKDNTNAGLFKSGLTFVESGDADFPYTLDYRITSNGVGYPTIQAAIDASEGGEVITVAAGTYPEVLKVTGGKNITIQPKSPDTAVVIGGVDHQSNGTASTVVFNDLTFDNSIQTAGWFTGTGNSLKVCVGAWGGNLSFNGCTFNVAGTSGAETGVMTWWTGDNLMSLSFKDCTFNGINDHASARAMQIYGKVNLTVDGCTFNTHKDYSLKYVGAEGTTAVLTDNIVNNTVNFVELGSSVYPGNAYVVTITGSTLGEGINDYVVANIEEQIVNGVEYSTCPVRANGQKFETVAAALAGTTGDVEITLKNGTYTIPNSGLAGRNITFVGESKEETIIDMSAGGTPQYNASSVTFKNVTMKRMVSDYGGLSHTAGEHYDNCIVEGTLVTYATNVSVKNTAFVPAANEGYNVHIYEGGNVSFDNCTFETLNCRSVYAYSESAKEMNISFNACSFTTKADAVEDYRYHQAIRIHTEYGIHGTLTIDDCSTDGNFNPAHNDGLWVEWNNGTKALTDNFVKMIDGVEVTNSVATVGGVSYTSLSEALADAGSGQTVAVKAGEYAALPEVNDGVIIECAEGTVFTKSGISGKDVTIKNATFSASDRAITGNLNGTTFENCTFDAPEGARYCYAYGDVVFNDCTFGDENCTRGVHFDEGDGTVTFNNCTLYGFQALGRSLSKVTFNDCTFAYNNKYNVVNMYNQYEYNRCKFNTSMNTDCCQKTSVNASYNSCTYLDGTAIDFSKFIRFDDDEAKDNAVITVNGKYMVSSAASLQKALTNATDGAELIVADGTYEGFFNLTGKKNVTIEAINAAKAVINGMVWADNCNVTLKGLRLSNPDGVQHPNPSNSRYYKSINEQYPLVGAYNKAKIKFDGCVFDLVAPTVYGFYGYAHNDPVFEGCTFNCNKIRPIANNGDSITVNGCTFNDQYHYSVRIYENDSERQTVVYTNNTVQGTNDKGEFEGVNISKKGTTATVCADFTVTGNTSDLKYRHHKNVTMAPSCTYIGITGFEKEN